MCFYLVGYPTIGGIMIKGTITITGVAGIGKSSLAQEFGSPDEIVVLNLDVKPYDLKDMFKFYREYNHIQFDTTRRDPQMDMVQAVLDDLESAPNAKVLIFDAEETFEKAFGLYVEQHIQKYRKNFYAVKGIQAVFERRGYVKYIVAGLLSMLQQKFETIFIINHLTDEWKNGEKTDRKIPISSNAIIQKAAMRLWLIETPGHRCPTALMIKDTAKHMVVNGRIRTMPFLPPKVSPLVLPDLNEREYVSFWDVFEHYWDNPVGNRPLEPFEQLTSTERDLVEASLTETFSQDEQNKINDQIRASALLSDTDLINLVSEMQGEPVPKILLAAKKINKNVTIDVIKQMLGELQ